MLFCYIYIYFYWHKHTIPYLLVPPRYSEAHWSWVHLQWHLPSAVHDCGEICLNLQGTVLNGSHWSTFADTVTDRANQPIMALETDRHSFTGEMGWDEFDWLTDCHRAAGALQNSLCTAGHQNYVGVWVCKSVYECVRIDVFCLIVYVWMYLWVWVVILIQITHCTLSEVTGKESGCQVGAAHIFKGWQN